jgi:hypothetical protein
MARLHRTPTKKKIVVHQPLRRCQAAGRGHVGWCYMMCEPQDGIGLCGCQAPHSTHTKTGLLLRRLEKEKDCQLENH